MSHSNNKNLLNVSSASSRRLAGDVVISDGATLNRAQVQTPGARGNLAGAPLASWVGWVDVGDSWANTPFMLNLTSSATAPFQNNSITMRSTTGSNIIITAAGANAVTDRRNFDTANFRTDYAGQRIWLEIRFTKGTSNPIVFVNCIDISSRFNLTTSGAAPEWLDSALSCSFHTTALFWPSGNTPLGCWLNAHLTNQESYNWMITGQPPAWVQAGGSMIPLYTSNFSINTDGWVQNIGNPSLVLTGNIDGISGVDDTLRVSGSGSFGFGRSAGTSGLIMGNCYRMTFSAFVESGAFSGSAFWGVPNSGNILGTIGQSDPRPAVTTDTWTNVTVEWRHIRGGTDLILSWQTTSSGASTAATLISPFNIYIKNVVITQLGALSLPNVQPIPVVDDGTAIGDNPAFLVGMTPIVQDGTKPCRIRKSLSWAGTHEQKTLFEGTSVTLPPNVVIQDVDTKATAASTGSGLTVGTTGTANRYVAANAFTTAKKVHTLANQIPSSTAANQLNIAIDPDTNNYTGTITTNVILNLQGNSV